MTTTYSVLKKYNITPFLAVLTATIVYLCYLAIDGFFIHKENMSAFGAVFLILYAGTSVVILTLEQLIVRKTFTHFKTFCSIEAAIVALLAFAAYCAR